jgi:hypothetical protein
LFLFLFAFSLTWFFVLLFFTDHHAAGDRRLGLPSLFLWVQHLAVLVVSFTLQTFCSLPSSAMNSLDVVVFSVRNSCVTTLNTLSMRLTLSTVMYINSKNNLSQESTAKSQYVLMFELYGRAVHLGDHRNASWTASGALIWLFFCLRLHMMHTRAIGWYVFYLLASDFSLNIFILKFVW